MYIFTNKRAVRNYTKKLSDGEIGEVLTIEDFISKIVYREGFTKINRLEREIIFNSVVREVKKDVFNIDTSIFNFLSYSRYFFSFFEELALEGVEIGELRSADYYEDYKNHIDILQKIYEKFEEKTKELKYLDPVFNPKEYEINFQYLKRVPKIEFFFEGRLSNFYLKLFREIGQEIPFIIEFTKSRFNSKISEQLDFKFENEHKYRFDLSKGEVLSKEKVSMSEKISISKFKNRIAQIGFLKKQIWIAVEKLGIEPEKIGVILLDEDFAPTIRSFDKLGNLNFSMGTSITETKIFKEFSAIYKFLENQYSEEHKKRIKNTFEDEKEFLFFKENWNRKIETKVFIEQIQNFVLSDSTPKSILPEVAQIFSMFDGENIKKMDTRTLFRLFLDEFEKITIDDVRGGKITVQGLLETRGAEYDFAVILDFNDEVFPKQEEKDFFINSEIRRDVNLPLIEDREGLQKLYFERVLQKAKYVSISYLYSETTKISRVFHDYEFTEKPYNHEYEKHLIAILMESSENKEHWKIADESIEREFTFTQKPISNSSLRTFLECRRRYYFKYILKIENGLQERNINFEVGHLLHKILNSLYSKQKSFSSVENLKSEFHRLLQIEKFEKTYKTFWTQKLESFFRNEIKRFNSGIKVLEVEKKFEIDDFHGFKLSGVIDRIDKLPNGEIAVIDYKTTEPSKFFNSNSQKNEHDFQLLFYYSILKELGYKISEENLFYYNLSSGKLIENSRTFEDFHSELENLKELEKEKIDFFESEKCSIFCEYKTICNKQ
jgi:ATP-dependent helicase/nuclease subunit B